MERLTPRRKPAGINGNALRTWALLFAACGIAGRGVIQCHMLGVGRVSTQDLLSVMGQSEMNMTLATLSLILQALETCAVPIFAMLLVEGARYTSDFKAYLIRVVKLAVLCELPYNLAVGGKLFDFSTRNPVFGLVLCQVLIYFFLRYDGKEIKNRLVRYAVIAAAVVWCEILKIEFGFPMVLIVSVLWAYRTKPLYRNFAGAAAAIVCSIYSPFFLASPMGFMAVHFYNEEPCDKSREFRYYAYPLILAVAAVAGLIL